MKLMAVCLLVLYSKLLYGLGRIVSYEELQTHLFGSIQQVETCGVWKHNGRLGEFRIIRLYYAGQDMLFADIVALNKNHSELNVIYGYTFSEINNDHAEIALEDVVCKPAGKNKIRIDASASNGHNDEKYKFSIIIDGEKKTYQYKKVLAN